MFAFIPFVLSRLWLTLRDPSLAGSIGSLTSLFSANVSSSSWASFEKAPSSISEIRLPVRSILLSVAVKQHNMDVSFPLGCNWKCFLLTLSSFTNYHAIPNLFDFISSVEHRKYSSLFCPCTHKNKCFKRLFFFWPQCHRRTNWCQKKKKKKKSVNHFSWCEEHYSYFKNLLLTGKIPWMLKFLRGITDASKKPLFLRVFNESQWGPKV